jgi:AcrR family transcriptional regulator
MTVEMTPLPRGRHRLSRDEVVGSQRMRILRAMAETMAERGYARTSVAEVLRRARVSRETFYEMFASKEDCFMGAFEAAYGHILDAMSAGPEGDEPSEGGRLARVLEDYLAALASDLPSARVFLIEVYAAGPEAIERRAELQRGLVEAIAGMLGVRDADERFAVEAVVAAIASLVTARVAAGDPAGVRALRDPILGLIERLGVGAA